MQYKIADRQRMNVNKTYNKQLVFIYRYRRSGHLLGKGCWWTHTSIVCLQRILSLHTTWLWLDFSSFKKFSFSKEAKWSLQKLKKVLFDVEIYRYFQMTFSYNCIHQTVDPCGTKGKTEQATVIQLEFNQSCVKTTHEIQLEFSLSYVKTTCEIQLEFSLSYVKCRKNSVSFVWRHVACEQRIIRVQRSLL